MLETSYENVLENVFQEFRLKEHKFVPVIDAIWVKEMVILAKLKSIPCSVQEISLARF